MSGNRSRCGCVHSSGHLADPRTRLGKRRHKIFHVKFVLDFFRGRGWCEARCRRGRRGGGNRKGGRIYRALHCCRNRDRVHIGNRIVNNHLRGRLRCGRSSCGRVRTRVCRGMCDGRGGCICERVFVSIKAFCAALVFQKQCAAATAYPRTDDLKRRRWCPVCTLMFVEIVRVNLRRRGRPPFQEALLLQLQLEHFLLLIALQLLPPPL